MDARGFEVQKKLGFLNKRVTVLIHALSLSDPHPPLHRMLKILCSLIAFGTKI